MRLLVTFLALTSFADASASRQQAAARVAVALVQLEIADERPALPDRLSGKRQSVFDQTDDSRQPRSSESEFLTEHNPLGHSMRIDWTPQDKGRINERPTVTIFTGESVHGKGWCLHCQRFQTLFGNGNDRVAVVYSEELAPGEQSYPALRFPAADGSWRFPAALDGTYKIPETLNDLADLVERNSPSRSYEATGFAGAIHARQQIDQAITQFRHYVGEGHSVVMQWERNGAEKLSLFARKEWSAKSIFGSEGRFEFSSPDATNLPVTQIAFSYRLRGHDVIIDPDPLPLPGLAERLDPNVVQTASSTPAQLIGIDDMLFAYSVFSMLRDICALLRPSCDLELPSELSASAMLKEDTLNLSFHKPAKVRLTWLFSFQLQIKSLAISDRRIYVEFDGSRFVKSREFTVQ